MNVKQTVETILQQATGVAYQVALDRLEVSVAEPQFGDFASNAAFGLAQELKKSPLEIAAAIAAAVDDPRVTSAEAAKPGFINVTMQDGFWLEYLEAINEQYLETTSGVGEKVQVEFISANPTGPLTLGNARGGFVGDVVSNVLSTQGYEVVREYYFNDAGTQIAKLIESYRAHAADRVDQDTPYQGGYMRELADTVEPSQNDAELAERLTEAIFAHYIAPSLDRAGINFDIFTNEKHLEPQFKAVMKILEDRELVYEQDGATWLKSTVYGDERDRVLIKSSGDKTYLANDLAYHYQIFQERQFDTAIKVWGADHAGQVPSLQLTVGELFGNKQLEFIIVQWVRLMRGGQEFKISKRAGTYVTVDELIDQIGADVARWFMLMRSNDTHMDFDLDLAAEQSQKNPYWYVMYAWVRAQAILREAAERGLSAGDRPQLLTGEERTIVKTLSQLPELLQQIATNYEVHKLTFYGQELAKLFHDWYENVRVIDLEPAEAAQKLFFLRKFTVAMAAYFKVLGIEPRDRM